MVGALVTYIAGTPEAQHFSREIACTASFTPPSTLPRPLKFFSRTSSGLPCARKVKDHLTRIGLIVSVYLGKLSG